MTTLKKTICLVSLLLFPSVAMAASLTRDGVINLYVYHVNEAATIRYLDKNGRWLPKAYQQINRMLRSRGDDKTTGIDKRLIELADHLQDHFAVDTIEVISGYRSPAFNKALKDAGRNVARESYHTRGMALDIHIDEIKEATLRDYLRSLKLGGVGYYGDVLMVHMDFGPVRAWNSGDYRDNTEIGVFNDESPVVIRTDKLFYGIDATLKLTWSGVDQIKALDVHKFHRGRFIKVARLDLKGKNPQQIKLNGLLDQIQVLSPYGKFRFHFKRGKTWQNSNEFYVKKQ